MAVLVCPGDEAGPAFVDRIVEVSSLCMAREAGPATTVPTRPGMLAHAAIP
jgi:hypothetical protein